MEHPYLRDLIERLTGQAIPIDRGPELFEEATALLEGDGMGFSQLNELLLYLGYDRVDKPFFQYLVDGSTEYSPGSAIQKTEVYGSGLEAFEDGVRDFQRLALLNFGNVKYAFKLLSNDAALLGRHIRFWKPRPISNFEARHEPVHRLEKISGEDTYFLGYLVQREIEGRLESNPEDPDALRQKAKRQEIVAIGKRNQEAYLASDHLDVYVATSMRRRHEFLQVSRWTERIFHSHELEALKLRWFDPTQAYCSDRIDKGLSEALMLKRASCTVYFAQESDTLGKDSELASTLAQGKPVIAFVPEGTETRARRYLDLVYRTYGTRTDREKAEVLLEQMKVFDPDAPWRDAEVRSWIESPKSADPEALEEHLVKKIRTHYDKRAGTLKEYHPLGIQVNIENGVANGVLVARTEAECAALVRDVVTHSLRFEPEAEEIDGKTYWLLREVRTRSIYRVMTGNELLTNTFWNFYSPKSRTPR